MPPAVPILTPEYPMLGYRRYGGTQGPIILAVRMRVCCTQSREIVSEILR
jgi:hypothetical protein